jgi:hypothetical protein
LLKVAKTSRKWLKMTKKVLPKAENGPEWLLKSAYFYFFAHI